MLDGNNRDDLKVGQYVMIVEKPNQRIGLLTEGVIKTILTKAGHHPHGIKVRLETGEVGRVKEVVED